MSPKTSELVGRLIVIIFTLARIPLFFLGGIYLITPQSTVYKAGCGFDCLKGREGLMNSSLNARGLCIKMQGGYVLKCKGDMY